MRVLSLVLMLSLASPVLAQEPPPQSAPKWAIAMAAAGPLADGITTYHALQQPGTAEGNAFFHHLFGSNVRPGEIFMFKVGQAALTGAVVYAAGKKDRKAAIGAALVMSAINFGVSVMNLRVAQRAKGMR